MRRKVIVRGGGDIATGTICHLNQCGFQVLVLECAAPTAIRRKVAFSEAVYDGVTVVEDICCRRITDFTECGRIWDQDAVPLLVDPEGRVIPEFQPDVVVDAILAKRNLGTHRGMAPLTIALGPGFTAGVDVNAVIETMRGHDLGRIIRKGSALPNTGVPGLIAGESARRVIHAPASGRIRNLSSISDLVSEGQIIAMIGDVPVYASLTGVLRGIIRNGFPVEKGLKIADIDPRKEQQKNCFTISDKARCIAGSVGEVIFHDLS